MKHAIAIVAAAMLFHTGIAGAEESLIQLDDPAVKLAFALGKQVNVRFASGFAKAHLPKTDYDGLVVSDVPAGKICLFGREQGIDPTLPALKDFARKDAGDICVPRAAVAVRVEILSIEGAPPVPFYSTVKASCRWMWKTGRGIGIWTEDCNFDNGHWGVVYDEANDWFALQTDAGEPFPVLRQYRYEGGLQGLLPELKAKGLVLDDKDCIFVQSTDKLAPEGWSLWDVEPVGKRREAFDALPADDVPEPPCGELGMAIDFTGFFMAHQDFAGRAIYVNLGQDGTMFDLGSVTLTK